MKRETKKSSIAHLVAFLDLLLLLQLLPLSLDTHGGRSFEFRDEEENPLVHEGREDKEDGEKTKKPGPSNSRANCRRSGLS